MNVIGQSPEKFNNIDPIFNGEFFTEYVDFILGTSARCLIYYYTAQKYAPDRIQTMKLLYEDEFKRALEEDGSPSSSFITPKTYYPNV